MISEQIFQLVIRLERLCQPLLRFVRRHWLVTTMVLLAMYQVLVWYKVVPVIAYGKWGSVAVISGLAHAYIVGTIFFVVVIFLPRERRRQAVEGQVVSAIRELNKTLFGVAKTMTGGHFDDKELLLNRVTKRRIDSVLQDLVPAATAPAAVSVSSPVSDSRVIIDPRPDLIPDAQRTAAFANRYIEFLHPDIAERLVRIEQCGVGSEELLTVDSHSGLVELFLNARVELEDLLDKHHALNPDVLSDRIRRQTEQGQITSQRWPARRLLTDDQLRCAGATALIISFQKEGRFEAARWVMGKYIRANEVSDLALELNTRGVSMPQNKPGTNPASQSAQRLR